MKEQFFLVIEDPVFQGMFKIFKPDITFKSADSVRRIIDKLFGERQNEFKKALKENSSRFSITLDLWTSPAMVPFLITIHYIDSAWNLRGGRLDLIPMHKKHMGIDIGQRLLAVQPCAAGIFHYGQGFECNN
jgi:hypothetical protein